MDWMVSTGCCEISVFYGLWALMRAQAEPHRNASKNPARDLAIGMGGRATAGYLSIWASEFYGRMRCNIAVLT
jgi:hypothetical protein